MDRLRWAGKYGQSSSLVGYPLGMGEVEGSNPSRSTIIKLYNLYIMMPNVLFSYRNYYIQWLIK